MSTKAIKNYDYSKSDIEIVNSICKGLKQMRLDKNFSQSQLADISGLDRTSISRIEQGRAATLITIVQILRALDNLEILDVFSKEPIVSPISMLREYENTRKRGGYKNRKYI